MNEYEVSVRIEVDDALIIEAESEQEAIDEATTQADTRVPIPGAYVNVMHVEKINRDETGSY